MLERAYDGFVAAGDETGQFYALKDLSILVYTIGESLESYDRWFPVLERQLSRITEFPSVNVGMQAWTAYLTPVHVRTGGGTLVDRAEKWIAHAFDSAELTNDEVLAAGDILLHTGIWTAQPDVGSRAYARLVRLVDQEDVPPMWRYHVTKDLGYWDLFGANYEQSLPFFERAVELATKYQLGAHPVVARCFRAINLCALGELEKARAALDEIRAEPHRPTPFADGMIGWASAAFEARRGNAELAFLHAQEALAHPRQAGFRLLETLLLALVGIYAVEANRIQEGLHAVRQAREITRDNCLRFADALLSAIEAEANLRLDSKAVALGHLRDALQQARNPRKAGLLPWAHNWLPRHFALALEAEIEIDTVRELIGKFNVQAQDATNETWPWPVRVFTLGAFEVQHDGEKITFSSKVPKKTLTLLKAIIALGGQSVPEQALIDALWPESEGDAGHEALKITVLRLRKLLGTGAAIELKEGRVGLNPKMCWVDAFAFESAADRLLDGAAGQGETHRLYRGSFLAQDQEQAWAVAMRERLRRKFVRLVALRGRGLEQRKEYEAAEQLYSRGLDADNLVEEFYQGLMRCHLACGRPAEGMDVFRRLRQILSVTLGIAPNAASQALFRALQNAASPTASKTV